MLLSVDDKLKMMMWSCYDMKMVPRLQEMEFLQKCVVLYLKLKKLELMWRQRWLVEAGLLKKLKVGLLVEALSVAIVVEVAVVESHVLG